MEIMKTLKKVAGVGAVGGIATGGYFVNDYFSIKNIEGQLKANNYEILSSSDDAWFQILASYEKTVANNKDLMFDDFDGKQPVPQSPNAKRPVDVLKEKCQKIIKDEKMENKDYKKAERWCIRPLTVSEKLRRLNVITLNTNEGKTDDDTKWEKILDKHKSANKDQIEKLKAQGFEQKPKEEKIKAIKSECTSLIDKKTYEEEFNKYLSKAQLWCAV